MRRHLALVLIVVLQACAPTHALHEKAQELWRQNMAVVDQSVESWKKRTGTAPYTPQELEHAIDFFETVTGLRGLANMSFIGPIPDESLERASAAWKAWYAAHGDRLTYDPATDRVILRKN